MSEALHYVPLIFFTTIFWGFDALRACLSIAIIIIILDIDYIFYMCKHCVLICFICVLTAAMRAFLYGNYYADIRMNLDLFIYYYNHYYYYTNSSKTNMFRAILQINHFRCFLPRASITNSVCVTGSAKEKKQLVAKYEVIAGNFPLRCFSFFFSKGHKVRCDKRVNMVPESAP